MICKYCNAENKDYAVFCEQCGKPLKEQTYMEDGTSGGSDDSQGGYGDHHNCYGEEVDG